MHDDEDEEPSHRVHIQYTDAERHKIVSAVTSPMVEAAERYEQTKVLVAAILLELDAAPYASRRAELQARLCALAATDNDAVVDAINAHAAQKAEDAHEANLREAANKQGGEAAPFTRQISIAPRTQPKRPRLRKDSRDGWAFQQINSAP